MNAGNADDVDKYFDNADGLQAQSLSQELDSKDCGNKDVEIIFGVRFMQDDNLSSLKNFSKNLESDESDRFYETPHASDDVLSLRNNLKSKPTKQETFPSNCQDDEMEMSYEEVGHSSSNNLDVSETTTNHYVENAAKEKEKDVLKSAEEKRKRKPGGGRKCNGVTSDPHILDRTRTSLKRKLNKDPPAVTRNNEMKKWEKWLRSDKDFPAWEQHGLHSLKDYVPVDPEVLTDEKIVQDVHELEVEKDDREQRQLLKKLLRQWIVGARPPSACSTSMVSGNFII